MPIQTVFLDAGGVLVNPNWSRVSETLARHGVAAPAALLAAAEPRAKKRIDTGETIRATNDQQRGWTYFNLVLTEAGIALSEATASALAELHTYHQTYNLWETVPDEVLPALAALRATGRRLVVLSNANGTLHRAFDRLGLTAAFDVIFDSHNEGVEKPDPRFFRIALERSGADASTTMHVGDLYHVDVAGARAAGLTPALLDVDGLYPECDCLRVRSLTELVEHSVREIHFRMLTPRPRTILALTLAVAAPVLIAAQQRGRGDNPFPGGANPDGSLRPTAPLTRLFTQDAYTEYEILKPGSDEFRIKFLPEESRVGATELVNATRGGSEGSGVEVYDPRTGKPLKFTYQQEGNDPENHAIHAALPIPVPQGGVGRVLIYKTYKDPRTYMMHGEDIVWVRSLSGYRLGVLLPKGFAFMSSNVAAQLTTTASGQLKLAFANPSGQSNPVTIHARKTTAAFTPRSDNDMFFDDVKTLYDLEAPEAGRVKVEQTYSDCRGATARLDTLTNLPLQNLRVIDLDTGKPFSTSKNGNATVVKLEVPIVDDRQSAHLKLAGEYREAGYQHQGDEFLFERVLYGLRNTIILPAGWDVAALSQSGTIGTYEGRVFVALINLNGENNYRLTLRARKRVTP